jgi:hypothetical protein
MVTAMWSVSNRAGTVFDGIPETGKNRKSSMPLSFEPAVPGPIGGALEGTQLAGLAAERGTEAINDHERRSPDRGTNRSGPKGCSGKVLGLIRLPSVPLLGALSVELPGWARRQ